MAANRARHWMWSVPSAILVAPLPRSAVARSVLAAAGA